MSKVHLLHPTLADETHVITVLLVGVGGTGTHMLTNLAMINHSLIAMGRAGLHVAAMDNDTVEMPNIGRQVFSMSDIGQNKAKVLIERINRYYGFQWVYNAYSYENGTPSSNIVITCVDNVRTRKRVSKSIIYQPGSMYGTSTICHYWLDIGNDRSSGQVILGSINMDSYRGYKETKDVQPNLPCFTDEFKGVKSTRMKHSCSTAEALMHQDLFINKILATYASQILWDLLKDRMIKIRGMYLNLENMQTRPMLVE